MAVLADTSAWIEHFRRPGGEPQLSQALLRREVVLPGLVMAEILQGFPREAEFLRMQSFLQAIPGPPELDREDYIGGARLYLACRARGFTPRGIVDCLLAQLAGRYGYTMLARDRDFTALTQMAGVPLQRC